MPGLAALGPAGPTGPHLAVRPGRAGRAGRAGPGRAAPGSHRRPAGRRNATGGKASAHTRPGRASACDRRPAGLRNATGGKASAHTHTTGPGFGKPPAQLIPRSWTDRTLSSLSSISPTIALLRSPNASSPRLASGSLLLPPFTRRSLRNSVEKNADRHLRFPN